MTNVQASNLAPKLKILATPLVSGVKDSLKLKD